MIADGVGYELSPAGTFGPEAHTWRFETDGFYGSYISGAQRLPNGNTLVNHGPCAAPSRSLANLTTCRGAQRKDAMRL